MRPTPRGAIVAAMVPGSPCATEVSVYVVRALARLREALAAHKELAKRRDELEARIERKLPMRDQAIAGIRHPPAHGTARAEEETPHRVRASRLNPQHRPAASP